MIGFVLMMALGISLIGWQVQGMAGRMRPHPALFRTLTGATAIFLVGGACALVGTLQIMDQGPGFSLVLLALGGSLFGLLWFWRRFQDPALTHLKAELKRDFETYRRDYPDLDEEALFRFLVRDRRPSWPSSRVEDLTTECPNLDSLARRLNEPRGTDG